MTNHVLRHALDYAGRGWPVFPCRPGKKTPATVHGHLDASADPDQVYAWFGRDPELNLAIATGAPGIDVLDIDQHGNAGDGFPALAQLESAGLLDRVIATVRTPSGGLHFYFTGSHQRTGHLPACHVDFLSRGGYVLAPPSQIGGTPYQHVTSLARHGELDWQAAVRVLQPTRQRTPAQRTPQEHRQAQDSQIDRLARWVAAQPQGNRNNGLYWAANRALETSRAADLSPLAAAARQSGLTEPEITATLESARRTTQAHPEPNGREAEGAS
jgi:Bifunctional DNA primase/polymerase, N-terminal